MNGKVLLTSTVFLAIVGSATVARAEELVIPVNAISAEGIGEFIGTFNAKDTQYGLLLTPNLAKLTPGPHGTHVHENPSCAPGLKNGQPAAGISAGGHYDPTGTGKHEGPYGDGHLGDLPPLVVADDGTATIPLLAPRLTTTDIVGRAIIIHSGGDNFSDIPKSLGGGGSRVACAIVAPPAIAPQ